MAEQNSVQLTVDGSTVTATTFKVAKERQRAGVILIHGGYGLEPGVLRMAKRLSLVNYTLICPDMFHRQGPMSEDGDVHKRIAALTWEGAQTDIRAAGHWLVGEAGVAKDMIGLIGFCMGGALGWMAAAALPIATAVLYYPHEVFKPFGKNGPTPSDMTPKVPVMAHFGGEDANPSPADMARMDELMRKAEIEHQFHSYQSAGHGFVSANPQLYRQVPANTSIDRTVGWLDVKLRPIGNPVASGFFEG